MPTGIPALRAGAPSLKLPPLVRGPTTTLPPPQGWEDPETAGYDPYWEADDVAWPEEGGPWRQQEGVPGRDEWYLQNVAVGQSFDAARRGMVTESQDWGEVFEGDYSAGPNVYTAGAAAVPAVCAGLPVASAPDPCLTVAPPLLSYAPDYGAEEFNRGLQARPAKELGIVWVTPWDEQKAFLQADKVRARAAVVCAALRWVQRLPHAGLLAACARSCAQVAATGNGSLYYINYYSSAALLITVPAAGEGGRPAAAPAARLPHRLLLKRCDGDRQQWHPLCPPVPCPLRLFLGHA